MSARDGEPSTLEDALKSRSTQKLTAPVCTIVAATALVLGMLVAGGCASNASRDWAQTSPVILPSHTGEPIVSLGAFERPS